MQRMSWQQKRAERARVSQETNDRVRAIRGGIIRRGKEFFSTDLDSPAGNSPAWEISSPFRHGSGINTTGPVDFTKPFGSDDH